jgi:hypothetical protein
MSPLSGPSDSKMTAIDGSHERPGIGNRVPPIRNVFFEPFHLILWGFRRVPVRNGRLGSIRLGYFPI